MNLTAAAQGRAARTMMVLALAGGASGPALAEPGPRSAPRFSASPAPIFRGKPAPLRLGRDDLTFRTRYRALARSEPNFAGHYAISEVGCGTSCSFLLTVDLKTGRTVGLDVPMGEDLYICPDGYVDAKGEPIDRGFAFRPDSRLLTVTGKMPGNACGVRYFEERNGRMVMIRDVHLETSQ